MVLSQYLFLALPILATFLMILFTPYSEVQNFKLHIFLQLLSLLKDLISLCVLGELGEMEH